MQFHDLDFWGCTGTYFGIFHARAKLAFKMLIVA
jgi:hypothetical protein